MPCGHFEQSDRVESSPAMPQEVKTSLTITQRKLSEKLAMKTKEKNLRRKNNRSRIHSKVGGANALGKMLLLHECKSCEPGMEDLQLQTQKVETEGCRFGSSLSCIMR